MSGTAASGVVLVAVLALVAAVVWLWPARVPEGRSVDEIQQRVTRENAEMDTTVFWPIGYPHDAPDEPLGVLDAQLTMQRHRHCSKEDCARKAAAWRILVEAGKIRPDTGRTY